MSVIQLDFGPGLRCGYQDIETGDIDMAVFGTGYISEGFNLTSPETTLAISVVALQVGSPSAPLVLTLYNSVGTQLGSVSVPAASVPTSVPAWIPFQVFAGTFPTGAYHVTVGSPAAASNAYYRSFINLGSSLGGTAGGSWTPPPGYTNESGGGYAVVWVQDGTGNDLVIQPFGNSIIPPYNMEFVAASSYSITGIDVINSDMEIVWDSPSLGFSLTDVTTGSLLGSISFDQYDDYPGGTTPLSFPSPINIVAGHTYQLAVTGGSLNYLLGVLLRGSTCDPASAAPAGVSPYWIGRLVNSDYSNYRIIDYISNHIMAPDVIGGEGGQGLVGVRFVAPSTPRTLTTMNMMMYDGNGTTGFYPSGTPVLVSIYSAADVAGPSGGSKPTGTPLAGIVVDSGTIPYNGWFSVSGFSLALTPDTPYWVVWSSPTTTVGYGELRLVSPYRFYALISRNGGTSWGYPGQGPSEFAWYGLLDDGSYVGSPYHQQLALSVGPLDFVAVPFIMQTAQSVNSIIAYVASGTGTINASIYADGGSGPNMSAPLGQGSGITFPTPITVQAGTKYWVVLSSTSAMSIFASAYWTRPTYPSVPAGYETLVSNNKGATWSPAGTEVTAALFAVGVLPTEIPPSQLPTSLTLTVMPV
jgi:hypothetical protein